METAHGIRYCSAGDDPDRAYWHLDLYKCGQQGIIYPDRADRLGLYCGQLLDHGVRLVQSTRYCTLYVPVVGTDEGAYYSHIWIER